MLNSFIHDVLRKKSNKPIDIMLDYKQMFDSECLFECMNDLYEAGVDDNIFALIYMKLTKLQSRLLMGYPAEKHLKKL